jgi:GAF domain-containing protein
MSSPSSLLNVLTRFARTLAEGYDVAEVLYDLSDNVVSVLGAKGAGVSLGGPDGKLVFVTATSDVITQVERVQQDSQQGPCHVAYLTNEVVVVEDISTHEEWATLLDAAVSSGLTSVLGVPLRVQARSIGSLNIYDTGARVWSPDELAAATVLADMAASYVAHASELDSAKRLNEQLQTALDSRVLIEQAKGILAGERRISVDEALDILRNHARSNQASLRAIAEAVVNLGMRP